MQRSLLTLHDTNFYKIITIWNLKSRKLKTLCPYCLDFQMLGISCISTPWLRNPMNLLCWNPVPFTLRGNFSVYSSSTRWQEVSKIGWWSGSRWMMAQAQFVEWRRYIPSLVDMFIEKLLHSFSPNASFCKITSKLNFYKTLWNIQVIYVFPIYIVNNFIRSVSGEIFRPYSLYLIARIWLILISLKSCLRCFWSNNRKILNWSLIMLQPDF